MKNIKISILCVIVAAALTIAMLSLKANGWKSEVLQNDSSYITSENLALNKGDKKVKKLTDGNVSTCYKSFSKNNDSINIDLKSVQEFNCIILKENGLNIKDFTILASENGETYTEIYHGDKIEYHRLCTFDTVSARYIRIFISKADSFFSIKEIEVYNQPQINSDDFRMTGYVLNTGFYEILQNDLIADKKAAIKSMLDGYNFSELTHVNFFCGVTFDEDGNVFVGKQDDYQNETQQESRKELKYMVDCMREFGSDQLKITFDIGNGSGNYSTNIAMDNNRDFFISNLINLANEIGFDGIDIDYEFPQSDYDFQTFSNFLIELKSRMVNELNVKEKCILSCAFGTRDVNYSQEVINALDMVNMMTYDIFDQDGEHSSFWSCAVQGAKYLEEVGFSKEQINIGIPFYGTQVDALMEQYSYKDAQGFDYYKNRYIFNSYYNASPTEVYFNSPAMVRDKTAYALLNEYGGIMVWHFSCDTDYSSDYSLWKAAYTAVNQFGGAK